GLGLGHPITVTPPGDTPDLAQELGPVRQIVAGGYHTCALLDQGRVRCWGANAHGQLGLGHAEPPDPSRIPDGEVDLGGPAVHLAAGHDFTCALVEDGDAVRCWGKNDVGQLGLGHTDTIGDDELPATATTVLLPPL